MSEPQPVILRPETSSIRHPADRRGIVELEVGERLELFCSTGFVNQQSVNNLILTCNSDGTFTDGFGGRHDFKYYNCLRIPIHEAVRSGRTCFESASILEVGFRVGSRFVKTYEICFDERLERTHYVTHMFSPANVAFQSSYPRPSWSWSGYFNGKNVDNLYTRNVQRNTLAGILGSAAKADEYIHPTNDWFLARGHIAAKTDFIYGNEHNPTHWMMVR